MNYKIEKYITNRNEWLLSEVKKKYLKLDFIFTKEFHARVSDQGEKATIYLPEDSFSEECISHELLHLYLETKENIVYCLLIGLIRENDYLKMIFSKDLIENMINCIHHIKMLPIFIQMGYDKANFLANSSLNKCEINYTKRIKKRFKIIGIYNKIAIDNYIGKYFAMKADISEIDYSIQLNILFETDNVLYNILQNFWTKWLKFDIYNSNTIEYWSDDFVGEFLDSLEKWIKDKKLNKY